MVYSLCEYRIIIKCLFLISNIGCRVVLQIRIRTAGLENSVLVAVSKIDFSKSVSTQPNATYRKRGASPKRHPVNENAVVQFFLDFTRENCTKRPICAIVGPFLSEQLHNGKMQRPTLTTFSGVYFRVEFPEAHKMREIYSRGDFQ